jgi:hypothetical protein
MKNKEYWHNRIFDLAIEGKSIALDKRTGSVVSCESIGCGNCSFYKEYIGQSCGDEVKEWAEAEYKAPHKIDPRINASTPVDTKILVSLDGKDWYERHFAKFDNDKVFAYDNGRTSWTVSGFCAMGWEYAKLPDGSEGEE